jgi:predicted amidophosphoribosyltransferase
MGRSFIQNLIPLRACLNCGSWINVRTFFCIGCHRRCLIQFQNNLETRHENIVIKSLFRWPPGKSDVLSALILQMKGESKKAWAIWADEFILKWEGPTFKDGVILVSSESSTGKKHAQNWAEALSNRLGYPHFCPLRPIQLLNAQKALNRAERAKRKFDLNEEFSKGSNNRVIFVDDVVTTGQTAKAAYKALGYPLHFEVWSLIYREL